MYLSDICNDEITNGHPDRIIRMLYQGKSVFKDAFQEGICSLNNVYFGMDFHAEAVEDIFLYLTAESYNLFASCTSFINKDKSLFVMNPCTSESFSFPTTLVNKPAGRELDGFGLSPALSRREEAGELTG